VRRTLLQTAAFVRAARRQARRRPQALAAIRETLGLLEEDAFDPRLRTHKLKGDLAGSWSCSAGYDLRIVFDLVQHAGVEAILLLSVGTHDEVY
jgi:mRNA-degrading endonuclease YafQ of YafQ-DinJ toxin-antitoxin module